MSKTSRSHAANIKDLGVVEDLSSDLDGYTASFVTIRESHDLGPLLAGLPGGNCPCPHWGYVFRGRLTVRYGDHEETIESGDAFYLAPGHVPEAEAGTELLQFSPTEDLAQVEASMIRTMQAGRSA
jgi:hypothetical protein